ncbi:class V chitinase-like [Lycium ferocissimum]|uniref:class V chitinase-like n=1 Tax=Lycium ferocissimum TaxID=112874 RepID=UPI0028164796|nr:class V chitinase-like [Lycium ferocissimum]
MGSLIDMFGARDESEIRGKVLYILSSPAYQELYSPDQQIKASMGLTSDVRKMDLFLRMGELQHQNIVWMIVNDMFPISAFSASFLHSFCIIFAQAEIDRGAASLLTAAVSYSPRVNSLTYPVQSMARNFDWINLMAYDFYAPNRLPSQTNSHAQLFDPVNHVSGSDGITAWIQAGVPTRKLVLGIPFYGYAWQLVNANSHGLRAPASGKSSVSPNSDGTMTYSQIRNYIVQSRATPVYDATIVGDYCYSGNTWIGYDDTQSVRNKITYVKGRGLLGYFAWHIAQDQNWVLSRTASQTWGASS